MAGEATEMQLSVKNIGSVTSPPFTVGFGYTTGSGGGGGFKAVQDPDGILPGEQTNYRIPRRLFDADVYSVTAEADNDNQIDEDDDDDNTASATLTVTPPPPGPNLIISSFTITPADICATDSATFAYTVSNTGTEPASDFFLMLNWENDVGGTGSYSGPFFEVNPGDTVSASDSHVIDSSGEYTFTAVVDPDNNVAESNEADNEAEAGLSVC